MPSVKAGMTVIWGDVFYNVVHFVLEHWRGAIRTHKGQAFDLSILTASLFVVLF